MRSVTLRELGTVILPNPIYTIGLPSCLAFAIHWISEAGGVQLRSGLSKNQLRQNEFEWNLLISKTTY
jgi:hypothetical protein